jgi:hypothetical protein
LLDFNEKIDFSHFICVVPFTLVDFIPELRNIFVLHLDFPLAGSICFYFLFHWRFLPLAGSFFSAFGFWFCGALSDRPQLMFVFPFRFLAPARNLPRTLARFRAQEFRTPVEPSLSSLTRPGDRLSCTHIWFLACLIFLWFPH